MNEKISVESAAEVMREAMRQSIRRYSLWFVVQGGLMILAGAYIAGGFIETPDLYPCAVDNNRAFSAKLRPENRLLFECKWRRMANHQNQ